MLVKLANREQLCLTTENKATESSMSQTKMVKVYAKPKRYLKNVINLSRTKDNCRVRG